MSRSARRWLSRWAPAWAGRPWALRRSRWRPDGGTATLEAVGAAGAVEMQAAASRPTRIKDAAMPGRKVRIDIYPFAVW